MKTLIAALLGLLLLIIVAPRIADSVTEKREADARTEAMKAASEKGLYDLARRHMRTELILCAKYGGGLPCEQKALLECRQIFSSGCEAR